MAKKKNAPVLRDGNNNQPAITKSYAVRDKWLDKAKDNLVEFKSVDGEISDLMVNGQPAGGGGGDLSMAEVTVTNNTGTPITLECVSIFNDRMFVNLPVMTSTTAYAILYKGEQGINAPDNTTVVVTGQITVEDGYITITGDGTITIS